MKTGARPRRRQRGDSIFAAQHRWLPAPRRGNSTARDAPRRPSKLGTVDFEQNRQRQAACVHQPKGPGQGISNTYENYDRGRALFPLANSCRDPVLSKRALAEPRSPSSYGDFDTCRGSSDTKFFSIPHRTPYNLLKI